MQTEITSTTVVRCQNPLCNWTGLGINLVYDEKHGIEQSLCPLCEKVVAIKIGSGRRAIVPENAMVI
jgi:hypothetical protein